LIAIAGLLLASIVNAQVSLPLPPCENRPPLPLQVPTRPAGLPPPLTEAPTCEAPMLEANAIGGAAAWFCKPAIGGAPVLYLYAVRWSALTPAMVADLAQLALPGDNAERIRAMQAKHQTTNVFDMCDVWGPMRERINSSIPAVDRFVVAKNGTYSTRPSYAVVGGVRAKTSKTTVAVGAPCDPTLTIQEASTYMQVAPGFVAICVKSTAPPPAPTPTGSATLSWTPPETMADGSGPAVLAGYRIQWGPAPEIYMYGEQIAGSKVVADPAATTANVTGLPLGLTYFVVRAIGANGQESWPSFWRSKVITADAAP